MGYRNSWLPRGLVPPTPPRPSDRPSERAARRRTAEADRARHRRAVRRVRLVALALVALVSMAVAIFVVTATGGPGSQRQGAAGTTPGQSVSVTRGTGAKPRPSSFAVGLRVLHLVDTSRTITLPNGTSEPRMLLTYLRYPALGAPYRTDFLNAPAARAAGPFPLVIFGHGFAVTPNLQRCSARRADPLRGEGVQPKQLLVDPTLQISLRQCRRIARSRKTGRCSVLAASGSTSGSGRSLTSLCALILCSRSSEAGSVRIGALPAVSRRPG